MRLYIGDKEYPLSMPRRLVGKGSWREVVGRLVMIGEVSWEASLGLRRVAGGVTEIELVFAGSVLWTEKIHRTELNWTVVQSIFRLWLPIFGVILVASCLISKIIQNHSKTSWNQLQLVKRSHALHSLVTTFITFNLIFGSSKTVKNWERYNEIHFGINPFFVQLVPEWL